MTLNDYGGDASLAVGELLGAREVCDRWPEIFKFNTLTYWRQVGRGPNWARLGRKVYYRVSDVQAWIDARFENEKAPAELQLDEGRGQGTVERSTQPQTTDELWLEKWLAVAPPMTDEQRQKIGRILAGAA